MNVYKVNDYWIAAKDADTAYGQYLEETDGMENMEVDDIAEGEETEITVHIYRLTAHEIAVQTVPCCEDGCDRCEDLNDHLYDTYQELLTQKTDFPCVLAKEI
ncbi:hypothetical protein [Paenibacillus sp. FSL R7-0333]|uniref:hypothetical protein n=1 Tax=Paenibacillus sp. FSL R7-0333 TaxID=1926587 RepID=UPI00096F8F8E|nr:hypothetical protein BK146_17835 [Paenibacillus sp. FSL R7-0333]